MQKYVSLLRGINVGGKHKIKMADLRALYETLDFKNINTYIQSGNVVFEYTAMDLSVLSDTISAKIKEQFDYNIPVLVLKATEISDIVKNNPYLELEDVNLKFLHVTMLANLPDKENLDIVSALNFEPDVFTIIKKRIYIYCPNGYGRTKITNNLFERKLKVKATTRNWKTMLKLNEMIQI